MISATDNVRDGAHVANRAAHIAVGVDMDRVKHVLGIWIQAVEGAKFWESTRPKIAPYHASLLRHHADALGSRHGAQPLSPVRRAGRGTTDRSSRAALVTCSHSPSRTARGSASSLPTPTAHAPASSHGSMVRA